MPIVQAVEIGLTASVDPSIDDLLATALAKGGVLEPAPTSRDVAAVLGRFRAVEPEKAVQAVAGAKRLLAGNDTALELLDSADRTSREGDPNRAPFGPVRHDSPGAIERLALLTCVGFSSDSLLALFSLGVDDFVRASGGGTPPVIHVASLVQQRLGGSTLSGLRWRDEVIPHLLDASFDRDDLVAAAAGGAPPEEWLEAEAFLTPWVKARRRLRPDLAGGAHDGGFLTGERPGAIHPLVLRILRPRLRSMLASSDADQVAEATAFNAFLADAAVAGDAAVAANPGLFPPADTPNRVLTAGAVILDCAQTRGATLLSDGTIAGAGSAAPLAALADRALQALLLGGESGLQPLPPSWQDKARLERLVAACPDWTTPPVSVFLRARAEARLAASLTVLGQTMKVQVSRVPSLDGATDRVAARPRAAGPALVNEVARAAAALSTVEIMSLEAAAVREKLDGQLASPFSQAALHRVLPGSSEAGVAAAVDVFDGTTATYLTRTISRLSADSLAQALDGRGTWAAAVNQQASRTDLPATWVALELWDGLRGRLIDPVDARDVALADTLAARLPPWLRDAGGPALDDETEIDVDALRPALAAVAHLGLPLRPVPGPPDLLSFGLFRTRLERLLDVSSPLKPDARSLVTAVWIELTLSLVAASSEHVTLEEVFSDFDDVSRFAQRGASAFESQIGWEARAGVNAWLLLSRLADATGDTQVTQELDQRVTPGMIELVASSVTRVLSRTPFDGAAVSALPLALVASDLSRFARESAQALDPAQTRNPRWLSSPQLSGVSHQAAVLTARLAERLGDVSAARLNAFAWQGGRAGRALLLSVFLIELNGFFRKRHFLVTPLSADDPELAALQRLETAVRRIICVERILLAGLRRDAAAEPPAPVPSVASLVPWWSLGYWAAPSAGTLPGRADATASDGRTLSLENWAAVFSVDIDALQLGLGAALSAAVPIVRDGEERDVDGLSHFALPDLSFQAALRSMATATGEIKEAEGAYARALLDEAQLGRSAEILGMLKKPLLFDTADAAEQVKAADAAVRAAAADLDAAGHESIASEFEAASVAMLYKASEVEVKRQEVIGKIGKLAVQIRELQVEATSIEGEIAQGGLGQAALMVKKARILQQQAEAQLQMAADSRSLVLKQIEVLNLLLKKDMVVTLPDGQKRTVPGQIAAMGLRLEFSLKKKLTDDESDARAKLKTAQEEEERRRELERQSSFIKGVLSFAGSVVGFVVGGPGAAALGSSLAGAAGDLVNGIIEEKPAGEILIDLAGDALTITKAAGVNLDGLLAQIGSIAGADAEQLFRNVESSIGPILDSLPPVLDESLIREAFKDIDLTGIEGLGPLVANTVDNLGAQSPSLESVKALLREAGVQAPIAFGNPATFRQRLVDQIAAGLKADRAAREAVRRLVGMGELVGEAQIQQAADRLSTLVLTRLGLAANGYRSDALSTWISAKQRQHKNWNEVSAEGNTLLEQLYPDVTARSAVQANVRLCLLDPETFQGEVQSFLIPWQQELDKRIGAVKEAGEQVLNRARQPSSPVEAAEARLNFILASEEKFGLKSTPPAAGSLLAFLQGNAPQRLDLFDQLLKQQEKDERAKKEIDVAKFTVDGTAVDLEAARLEVIKAEKYLQKTGVFLQAARLEVQEATLQTTVNDLAKQHAEDTSAAQEKASESAAEKVKASAARIEAAKASLEGRRAQFAGARLRAAEAGRIREALAQPPLRLAAEDAIRGTIAFARIRHADALGRGLRASRQILRLLRAAQIPEADWPRPDSSIGDSAIARTPWSVSLTAQSRAFVELFQTASAPSVDFETIRIRLEPRHIRALQSPAGLQLRLRPGVAAITEDDRIQQNILEATGRSGRVVAVLFAGTVLDQGVGVTMTGQHYHASAEYRGDRWLSPAEVHFIDVQKLKSSRVSLMDPKSDPVQFVLQQGELRDTQGDPRFNDVPGTPTSGTTVLRLVNVNPRPPLPGVPVTALELTVLHSFFD